MDIKLINKLAKLMETHDLAELEVEEEGHHVHLKRGGPAPAPVAALPAAPAAPAAPAPVAAAGQAAPEAALPPDPDVEEGTVEFTSPLVGTFYRAATPEADPFAVEGDVVDEDTVICIVEAMKVMNEIKADGNYRVTRVLVENGEPVEYGQALFLLAPA